MRQVLQPIWIGLIFASSGYGLMAAQASGQTAPAPPPVTAQPPANTPAVTNPAPLAPSVPALPAAPSPAATTSASDSPAADDADMGDPMVYIAPTSAAKERLARVNGNTTLEEISAAPLNPWHMKVSVKLLSADKRPTTATIEEWWTAVDRSRVTYTSDDYNATIIHAPEGIYRTKKTPPPPYLLTLIASSMVHPGPRADRLLSADVADEPRKFGKLKSDCMVLRRSSTQGAASVPVNPIDMFSSMYCIADTDDRWLLINELGNVNLIRTGTGVFQKRDVVVGLRVLSGNVMVAEATLDSMSTVSGMDDATFRPTKAETRITRLIPGRTAAFPVPGSPIFRNAPELSAAAKAKQIAGQVMLHVTIGQDGKVYQPYPIASPDDLLTTTAEEAVKHWVFRPATLNGDYTEVDTVLTVNLFDKPAGKH